MPTTVYPRTRRNLFRAGTVAGAVVPLGLLTQACAPSGNGARENALAKAVEPTEVLWASHFAASDPRDAAWRETWKAAEEATRHKITVVPEIGNQFEKRQTEFAAGSAGVDLFRNTSGWVIAGGLNGLFVDHAEYMRRDKVDTKQYYQAELTSWGWKDKLWGIPWQSGGEVVIFNKKLFDARGSSIPPRTGPTMTCWT